MTIHALSSTFSRPGLLYILKNNLGKILDSFSFKRNIKIKYSDSVKTNRNTILKYSVPVKRKRIWIINIPIPIRFLITSIRLIPRWWWWILQN